MKKKIFAALIYLLLVAALPAVSMLFEPKDTPPAELPVAPMEQFSLFDEAQGRVLVVSATDYLIGALACDIPADYEPQALLAQAVATHSYALYLRQTNKNDASLLGADFRVNTAAMRGYMTEQQQKTLFAGEYQTVKEVFSTAASTAINYILTVDGEPIAACFHAVSCGVTESGADIFGFEKGYLISVDSAWDKTNGSFASKTTISPSELSACLARDDFSTAGDPSQWLGESETTANGTVTAITVCGRRFDGLEFRDALNLRSANFTWSFDGATFVFETKGFGHGVGMSQYGANRMATAGRSFDEILAHYYPGTTLSKKAG